jgi:hypothetical protein
MKHEAKLRAAILSARDKPEAALAYARWLLKRERFTDALIITEAALTEGPRFDLYELRAFETLTGLERVWSDAHAAAGLVPLRSSTDIYNGGLANATEADWTSVLARLEVD